MDTVEGMVRRLKIDCMVVRLAKADRYWRLVRVAQRMVERDFPPGYLRVLAGCAWLHSRTEEQMRVTNLLWREFVLRR